MLYNAFQSEIWEARPIEQPERVIRSKSANATSYNSSSQKEDWVTCCEMALPMLLELQKGVCDR